jgi:hypothetical protein
MVREREAAGARYGGSKLRVTMNASIPYEIWTNQEVRETRHVEIERTEERRRSKAHRWRRNRPEMLAGRRHFGEEFFGG